MTVLYRAFPGDYWRVWKDLQFSAGSKNDKQGNVHSIVGKLSFGNSKLKDNITFFVKTMKAARPSGVKGSVAFMNTVFVCNAMGPGIRLDANSI